MNRLVIFLLTFLFLSQQSAFSQDENSESSKNWRVEIEPSPFILNGFFLHIGRNLTKDGKLSMALYTLATDVPDVLTERIFDNTVDEDVLRVGLQLTLNTRYKIELFKDRESNPYIGLVSGWEYFTLVNPAKEDLRVDVILLTPYIGGEIYFYKDVLYVNPQLRSVLYLNPTYSIENRTEEIKQVFFLPQISLGWRF
ncbi:MAG: hypothetical protein R8P61_22435 [Bacteroidia bacterium]|nr:hypothetical protein [Bacteroidia bacterium]